MFELVNITAIRATSNPLFYSMEIEFKLDGVEMSGPFGYHQDDPADSTSQVKQWLIDNAGSYTILPYSVPVITDDEKRAAMPDLSARQFWMAAASIDIDKDSIITTIKANMADGVDRKMMIAELESSSFERVSPTIVDVMGMMNIPADQVDDLWTWAAGL